VVIDSTDAETKAQKCSTIWSWSHHSGRSGRGFIESYVCILTFCQNREKV